LNLILHHNGKNNTSRTVPKFYSSFNIFFILFLLINYPVQRNERILFRKKNHSIKKNEKKSSKNKKTASDKRSTLISFAGPNFSFLFSLSM
jgi:hypothetical protein